MTPRHENIPGTNCELTQPVLRLFEQVLLRGRGGTNASSEANFLEPLRGLDSKEDPKLRLIRLSLEDHGTEKPVPPDLVRDPDH